MKVLLLGLISLVYSVSAVPVDGNEPVHWALLVAGSSGWYNYRHQADVCHSYQVLHNHGIPDSHIVVMMYDDIANNKENKMPGIIINHPNGSDVYAGVPKDYTGEDVTPDNFLKVLQGDKSGMTGIGSGKVIESGPNDNVFVYFSDHGATDLIGFPSAELMETDLKQALENMSKQDKFKKFVFYLEACESGSMFDNFKIKDLYVTTASAPDESSYACYFDDKLGTFLGDVYSVRWMEDSDKANFNTETLLKQFKAIRRETNTSHVEKYGDLSIDKDTLGEYQGSGSKFNNVQVVDLADKPLGAVPSPEVPMAILHHRLMAAKDPSQRNEILQKIVQLGQAQQKMMSVLQSTVSTLLDGDLVDKAMSRQGVQVTNWDCYKTSVRYFSDRCFPFKENDFALSLMYIVANLCERQEVSTDMILSSFDKHCK
ncbi:legumain-like [Asterias rubens]|uniref:legumain-like n=1 Tax=Asterias rubens TaxID=7604 RepID=UPI001454E4C2|nr:legumain-like [Asterias rubens]XP_033627915.1 legumain-like [Asterias rubens]XP_033627924.1 legumain-like [Asterias rubens]